MSDPDDGNFGELFNNERLSDATVQCGDKTYFVHKVVLCTRCKWFSKAFESGFKETHESKVILGDLQPERVEWLLRYLYTDAYELDGIAGFSKNPFLAVSEANNIADFFMLDSLQVKLAERLEEQLRPLALQFQYNEGSPNIEEIFTSAFDSRLDGLDFWDYFFQGVTQVYNSEHDTTALLNVFVKFGGWTLESVPLADLCSNLKKESRFTADVFCRINCEREARTPHATSCGGCNQPIFEGGRHFTEMSWLGTVLSCSDCYE